MASASIYPSARVHSWTFSVVPGKGTEWEGFVRDFMDGKGAGHFYNDAAARGFFPVKEQSSMERRVALLSFDGAGEAEILPAAIKFFSAPLDYLQSDEMVLWRKMVSRVWFKVADPPLSAGDESSAIYRTGWAENDEVRAGVLLAYGCGRHGVPFRPKHKAPEIDQALAEAYLSGRTILGAIVADETKAILEKTLSPPRVESVYFYAALCGDVISLSALDAPAIITQSGEVALAFMITRGTPGDINWSLPGSHELTSPMTEISPYLRIVFGCFLAKLVFDVQRGKEEGARPAAIRMPLFRVRIYMDDPEQFTRDIKKGAFPSSSLALALGKAGLTDLYAECCKLGAISDVDFDPEAFSLLLAEAEEWAEGEEA